MKATSAAALLLLGLSAPWPVVGGGAVASASVGAGVTPVQKVIQLLTDMSTKGSKEKHDEQVQFAAYKQFCDDTTTEKQRAIQEAEESIEMLTATIAKHTSDVNTLTKEIAGHDADVASWTGDKKAATQVDSIERADYEAMHQDLSESVDALQRAIQILKSKAYDKEQAPAPSPSLVEVAALRRLPRIPKETKRAIDVFLEEYKHGEPTDGLSVTAPEAMGYEFRSHGIIEMLEKLLDKFVDEKTGKEKEEMNRKHAFDLLKQDLAAQIDQGTKSKERKSGVKAEKLQAKADATADLTEVTATKEADEKYLRETTATCEQKASDFETRQSLRTEELEAISKAIEILSGSTVTGAAEKHLPTLLQQLRRGPQRAAIAASLAQLRATGASPTQERAAEFLRERATRFNSRVLSALAVRVSDDPFAKVKKMIQDLIVRLMEEANEEAEHKGWCDTELATNEQTRKEKAEAVETLHAEIDQLESSIATLKLDIAELSKSVTELDSAMANATALRKEESAVNTATVKDSQEAQTAVAEAIVVLKEFYEKAGEATVFVQRRQQPTAPAIFDAPYQGMQAEKGGVVGLLEVIQSDFARLEAETKAAEATAQTEHDDFMTTSKVDKAQKEKSIEHKTAKVQDEQQAHTSKSEDLEGTQKELDAALMYFDKLKPSCIDAGVSYEDRVQRRQEEIQSLKEALRILSGESP